MKKIGPAPYIKVLSYKLCVIVLIRACPVVNY